VFGVLFAFLLVYAGQYSYAPCVRIRRKNCDVFWWMCGFRTNILYIGIGWNWLFLTVVWPAMSYHSSVDSLFVANFSWISLILCVPTVS